MLARKREALAARHTQARPVDRCEVRHRVRHSRQEVLGIVDHHQHVAPAQALPQHGRRDLSAGTGDLQRLSDRRENQRGILQRRERDPPDAVSELVRGVGRGLQREPRLAYPARPRQRHKTHILTAKQGRHSLEIVTAPEKRCRRHRQVRAMKTAQRREVPVAELEEPQWSREILQTMLAEIHDIAGDVCPRRVRQNDLPTVGDAGDTCRTVNVEANMIALLDERQPGVDPDPHPDRTTIQP